MSAVNYRHPLSEGQLAIWRTIRDCIAGSDAIRRGGERYLPKPNATDTSKENERRYQDYLKRAVFYNVTAHTLKGLVGLVFAKEPVAEVPAALDIVVENANGAGASLEQLARRALADVIAYGRAGLLTDYPTVDSVATKADLDAGYVRPTISAYSPESILNWRTTTIGAKQCLSLVVLAEKYLVEDDGFELKTCDQWRVLRLVEGVYQVEIWREGVKGTAEPVETIVPRDAQNRPLREIPFSMIGSVDNDPDPDPPLLADLAVLNLAHYRNSADYEESCFIVGQPTAFASGLTQQWMETHWKNGVSLGSRAFLPLPAGASAGLIQAAPNGMPFEAMQHKERQMVAIGARLIEQRQVQRTATETSIETKAETSALACSAQNVSRAMTAALKWCGQFVGATGGISYDLCTDYDTASLTAADIAQLVATWQAGAITYGEMRFSLRASGIAYEDDEAAKEIIEAEWPGGARGIDPAGQDPASKPDDAGGGQG